MALREFDFGSLVRDADPDHARENRFPVVYRFPRGREFRSSGPKGGVYDPQFHAAEGIDD